MIRLFGLGVGIGGGIQAWRNFPADGFVSPRVAIALSVVAILCAWFGGRRRAGAVAVASAEATAVASNQVNVAVFAPGGGAGSAPGMVAVPGAVDWLEPAPAVEAQAVMDGLELSELIEEEVES